MNIESLTNHICYNNIFNDNKNADGTYNWLKISKIKNLPTSFIDKYFLQIYSYRNLEKSGNLSQHIIKKYGNYLNWNLLLSNQLIDEEILIKFNEKIDFKICSLFQDLPLNFLIRYKTKINIKDLEKNSNIKVETINAFKNYLASFT